MSEIDAFIYDATVLQYRVGKDKDCKLRTVGNWYSMTGYGVGFPKGSKWLDKINHRILTYRKNGQLERWSNFWFTGACQKTGKLRNSNQTLGVKNFISAFILLIGGMLLCCALLLLEHSFYRYMRPRLKEWDKYGCCGLVSISMGQLLSFEQSVNQTVDLIKHHRCRNPICETQLWKARHELDLARRKVQKLEALLSSCSIAMDSDSDYLQIINCSEEAQAARLQPLTIQATPQCKLSPTPGRQRCHGIDPDATADAELELDGCVTTDGHCENGGDSGARLRPLAQPPQIALLHASPRSQLRQQRYQPLPNQLPLHHQQQPLQHREILYRHPSIKLRAGETLDSVQQQHLSHSSGHELLEKESVL